MTEDFRDVLIEVYRWKIKKGRNYFWGFLFIFKQEFNLEATVNFALTILYEMFYISVIINAADSPVDEVYSN